MAYLLDANVFIDAKNRYYGLDFAPGFWDWIDREHDRGHVFSIEKVRDELLGGDDELADWARARGSDFFLPPDQHTLPSLTAVAQWARSGRYEESAANTFLDAADYYLVAQAHALGHGIVTLEKVSTSTKRIKIPDACVAHNVKTLTTFSLLRNHRVRLSLDG